MEYPVMMAVCCMPRSLPSATPATRILEWCIAMPARASVSPSEATLLITATTPVHLEVPDHLPCRGDGRQWRIELGELTSDTRWQFVIRLHVPPLPPYLLLTIRGSLGVAQQEGVAVASQTLRVVAATAAPGGVLPLET